MNLLISFTLNVFISFPHLSKALQINIACMPSIRFISHCGFLYYETIVCKWKTTGIDFYDNQITANNDCKNIGFTWGLDSTGWSSVCNYSNIVTSLYKQYFNSSNCGKNFNIWQKDENGSGNLITVYQNGSYSTSNSSYNSNSTNGFLCLKNITTTQTSRITSIIPCRFNVVYNKTLNTSIGGPSATSKTTTIHSGTTISTRNIATTSITIPSYALASYAEATNSINSTATNTTLSGRWGSCHTIFCILYKRRKTVDNITNNSIVETMAFEISSLGECDNLDTNYTGMKKNRIINETKITIERITTELAAKLEELEKEKEALIETAKSFAWLASLVILILFLIFFLNDSQRLFCYLKEKSLCVIKKRKNKTFDEKVMEIDERVKESVLRQVRQNDAMILNHPYFQKRRNMN